MPGCAAVLVAYVWYVLSVSKKWRADVQVSNDAAALFMCLYNLCVTVRNERSKLLPCMGAILLTCFVLPGLPSVSSYTVISFPSVSCSSFLFSSHLISPSSFLLYSLVHEEGHQA